MRETTETYERFRLPQPHGGPKGHPYGAFQIGQGKGRSLRVIASRGGGWDHVSVSLPDRTPTWEEMNWVKGIFFGPDEWVVQYHPAESDYVNCHPFCLHLWRPQTDVEVATEIVRAEAAGQDWVGDRFAPPPLPIPPAWMVGPRGVKVGAR